MWHSPLHRVLAESVDNKDGNSFSSTASDTMKEQHMSKIEKQCMNSARNAIVFFTTPLPHCMIEVCRESPKVASYMKSADKITIPPPIRSGDHLLLKLKHTATS